MGFYFTKIKKHSNTIIVGGLVLLILLGGYWFVLTGKNERGVKKILSVGKDDFILGNHDAPVTMIEYSDFQCPFCGRFFKKIFPLIKTEYINTGKVKFVFRDFILYGKESIQAANAARCAGEQGMFWEYHDLLFFAQQEIRSGAFSIENLKKIGQELNLDNQEKFQECVTSGRYDRDVNLSWLDGRKLGVWGTPSFFLNDTGPIFGLTGKYNLLRNLIENALEEGATQQKK